MKGRIMRILLIINAILASSMCYSVTAGELIIKNNAYNPTTAKTTLVKSDINTKCLIFTGPVYDASGYWYHGTIHWCPDTAIVEDLTQGTHAPKKNEQVILSEGRYQRIMGDFQSSPSSIFIRGVPNTSYIIPQNQIADGLRSMFASTKDVGRSSVAWNAVGTALPFVPSEYYQFNELTTRNAIGLGGIRILPSKAKEAYPINSNSIILMMNGISFETMKTFVFCLMLPWPQERPKSTLVEIIYIQKDENPVVLRRALIPIFRKDTVAREWANATADITLNQNQNFSNDARSLLVIGTALVAIAVGKELAERDPYSLFGLNYSYNTK